MITNPIDGMRVLHVAEPYLGFGVGTLRQDTTQNFWYVDWHDSGASSPPFLWSAYGALFKLADATVPTPVSAEPMTDRERLLALRAREGRDGGYGFVT